MIREEAIEILCDVGDINRCCAKDAEALDIAIKALEQQPCDDTISRERVLEVQMKYAEHMGATKYWQMRDDIKALPSITLKQKTGHWKELEKITSPNELICECSVCGHVVSFLYYPKSNYCPKCGAKMTESEE